MEDPNGETSTESTTDLPPVTLQGSNNHMEPIEMYHKGGLHPVHLDDVINGRYRVLSKLGYGGFGTVWLCRDIVKKRYVAVKIEKAYRGDLSNRSPPMDLQIAKLDGSMPGGEYFEAPLETFTLFGPNGAHLVIVTAVLGPKVNSKIWRYIAPEFQGRVLRRLSLQATEALQFLHSNEIYHGDFRPNNILLKFRSFDHLPEKEVISRLSEGEHPKVAVFDSRTGETIDHGSCPRYLVRSISTVHLGVEFLELSIRVIDFGVSGYIQPQAQKANPTPCLPKQYLPPDWLIYYAGRVMGEHRLNRTSLCSPVENDKWSLACTLSEIRLQEPLFHGLSISGYLRDMVYFFGKMPQPLWDQWKERQEWFDDHGGEPLLLSYEEGPNGKPIPTPDIEPRLPEVEKRIQKKAAAAKKKTTDRLYTLDWALQSQFEPIHLQSPDEKERSLLADLLKKMCAYTVSERLELSQVLEHDWFKM